MKQRKRSGSAKSPSREGVLSSVCGNPDGIKLETEIESSTQSVTAVGKVSLSRNSFRGK